MIQSLVDKGIAARKVLENIRVVDVIKGDLKMLESPDQGRVFCELPVNRRDNVCDVCCLKLFVAP